MHGFRNTEKELGGECVNKREIEFQLQNPAKDARGRTRWWWYGCAVEKEELIRELNFMQEAGIGGVELQILYALEADNEEKGIKNVEYLSPEFMELVRFAADEANKRQMQFDLTLGSSWPFGGPFITEELSGQTVLPFSIDVQGPCSYSIDLTTVLYGKVVGAVLGKMHGAQMLPDSIVDITDRVEDKFLFNWPWGTKLKTIDVPDGLHKIVFFVSSDKKQHVLKPLRGGDGLIIDHNRKESLREFLKTGGDAIWEAVGDGKIANFFCDSIEVFGHNWTEILYEEFRKRRGYELRPYIYALWGEIQGMTEQVRYDFQKTMSELTVENFFREMTEWCHEKHALSRIQAHGTWGDVLQAYGAADIPEGETFSAFDRYEVNTIHRRLAVSAGHVYNKPIISNESFTWLRFPRFVVSLEHIKAAADSIFLDGINQIVNHGYGYSKADEGQDMLAFYASTNINHTNTWWKYYPQISTYINRVCDFMQRGRAVVTTAVYLPQHDIWAEMPIADVHMCMKLDERLGVPCMDAIHKAGYWFDYVNDEVLTHWQDYNYDTLLLIECDRIPVDTMQAICEFARKGGTVIAAERMPTKTCGLLNYEQGCRQVREMGQTLLSSESLILTQDKFKTLIAVLEKTKMPDVKICHHADCIGYVHRKTETEDYYFISNVSDENRAETIVFSGQTDSFCVFDPMDGKERPIYDVDTQHENTKVTLEIEALQSLLFVFSNTMERPVLSRKEERTELFDISSGWELEIEKQNFKKKYEKLTGWELEKELRYYSGFGQYSKTIHITEKEWERIADFHKVILKFEQLGETAEVNMNHVYAGVLFKKPYEIDITHLLRQGENSIEILAANLLINRMIDPDYPEIQENSNVIERWPYATGGMKQCRAERLFNWRERDMIKKPLPSGVRGSVKLIGVR